MTDSLASGSESGPPQGSRAFLLLHPRVQRWVWRAKWPALRPVQEQAIAPVLAADEDVLIAAGTAQGKTEAAFLPICSRLVECSGPGVRALYVGPLKALINDQFRRLDEMCEGLAIPVHRWHGDVSAAKKSKLVKSPSGILLITPESLEAQFVLRGTRIVKIFGQLEHVVLDEFHAYLGSERGRQLQSLLHRLELAIRRRVPRVGLSATLGDVSLAAAALRPLAPRHPTIVSPSNSGQELRVQIRGYRIDAPRDQDLGTASSDDSRTFKIEAPGSVVDICADLFEVLRGSNNLLFTNSRSDTEAISDRLRTMCEERRLPNEFFPHHGNLSKEIREDVERRLKEGRAPVTAVCTSTLELGIDLGAVTSVAQYGPPMSVAAMRQRLGRSGRRDEPAVLRIYVREHEVTEKTAPEDSLRAGLVQSIAMLNLLLNGWCEPPPPAALHLSTLVQQTLSMISRHGSVRAGDLWNALCDRGPFNGLDAPSYGIFLRDLGRSDLVTQLGDGTLTLGLGGERLVSHYSFFTAFQTPEEWRVCTGTRDLGSLPLSEPLMEGAHFVFAGRRWRVASLDEDRRVLYVVPAPGAPVPRFAGAGGTVHGRVRQEMLAVYQSAEVPQFLDSLAVDLLDEGRKNFARLGLHETPFLAEGTHVRFFPWRGDHVMDTIALLLQRRGAAVTRTGVALSVTAWDVDRLREELRCLARAEFASAVDLAAAVGNKCTEKHDQFLSDGLLAADYASKRLDTEGAYDWMVETLAALEAEGE